MWFCKNTRLLMTPAVPSLSLSLFCKWSTYSTAKIFSHDNPFFLYVVWKFISLVQNACNITLILLLHLLDFLYYNPFRNNFFATLFILWKFIILKFSSISFFFPGKFFFSYLLPSWTFTHYGNMFVWRSFVCRKDKYLYFLCTMYIPM